MKITANFYHFLLPTISLLVLFGRVASVATAADREEFRRGVRIPPRRFRCADS